MTSTDPRHTELGAPEARESSTRETAVSIIIPVHNKMTITRQCLDALLAEPRGAVTREILVVDDGSADTTPAMLAGYGDRIRVLRNEQALGFAGACNAGAAAARGEYLVLLNNDTIPKHGWLAALVNHAQTYPKAAIVGAKLLFPNETIQHAGVVFGLDRAPHHIYAGFPADHPAANVSRRYQVVTAACALFRREAWEQIGGLDTSYRNGWEDVDFCMRAGELGYEIHYCAESVLYHFESSTRDLYSPVERQNRAHFNERWQERIVPDDFGYYWVDGLLQAVYGARYPIQIEVSPLLAGISDGENERLADRILFDRARQVMILLRNNIILNVRVQEAEARAADAERRLSEALLRIAGMSSSRPAADAPPAAPTAPDAADVPATAESDDATAAALPHRIVGMVESPGRTPDVVTDGILIVSGWTLTAAGDAKIEAIIDGEGRATLPYGDIRTDAAALYPGYPAGASCGFASEIAVGDLPDGFHEVIIRISTSAGDVAQLVTTFEIDNHAFETGRVIGRLDHPVRGAIFIPQEYVQVSGWALAPAGIKGIEILVDGEPRGRVDYGALRPDIGKRRREYAEADHCGFSSVLSMKGLAPGSHDLVVNVTGNDGKQLELPTRIEVDAFEGIDAGLPVINRHYRAWLDRRAAFAEATGASNAGTIMPLLVEAIVPLAGSHEESLEVFAESMRAQSHRGWRLTLLDTGDASEATRLLARRLALADGRIAYHEPTGNALVDDINRRLTQSDAPWVTFLHPRLILAPAALIEAMSVATESPETVMIYVDDDRIDPASQERWNPFFKPDWSPDLLLAMNYLGPLTLFRRDAVNQAGGLHAEVPGAEVYDLALRVTDNSARVAHIPEVLVTAIERAPASDEPWRLADWQEAERRAIADTLCRRGIAGDVERGLHPGAWRVRYDLPEPPGVTAVIPTGGKLHLLRPCLEDLLERTDYPNFEILLVDNSGGEAVAGLVEELSRRYGNIHRIVDDRRPFNYSALVNAGMRHVTTPYALMLNDDITVINPGWLRALVEHAQRPEVGVVGAKLLYPDDTIQHAGVILGPHGGSVHVFKRFPGDNPGFFNLPDVVRNTSAVTFACALLDRAVFEELGGLDEEHLPVAFNDTDYCLRAREAGYEVIYTPHAALHHHESVTKTVIAHPHEIGFLRTRWGHVIKHDPYYNPNLTRAGEDARRNLETTSAA
jgi:GT2 family glycosyltransferase